MPRPKTSADFRKAVGEAFRSLEKKIRQSGKTPAIEIARKLGVSRQVAYQYLRGKTIPNTDRLAKAVRVWNLEVKVRGHSFGREAFVRPSVSSKPAVRQVQLGLDDGTYVTAKLPLAGNEEPIRFEAKGSKLSLSIEIELDRSA